MVKRERPEPSEVAALIHWLRAPCLLLDFDGPICRLFAGRPALGIAEAMHAVLGAHGVRLADLDPEVAQDPHRLVRVRLAAPPARALESLLAVEEEEAALTAEPTPGAEEFVRLMAARGRTLAITTNNAPRAVAAYLKARDLDAVFGNRIYGRDPDDPSLMKPHPDCLRRATRALGAAPADCLMIGDSVADAQAANAAGVPFLGYARTRARAALLAREPGVRATTVGMAALVAAARALAAPNE